MKRLYGILALALYLVVVAKAQEQPRFFSQKVPLEIHIMSKCPDARDCVDLLIAPTLEQAEDLVEFRMSFIGTFVFPPLISRVLRETVL